MEKTINFSIFKEKIIKTDELLGIVVEKNKSLAKSQKWIQHLKSRSELAKNEINKLKIRNDALVCDLRTSEKNYTILKADYDQLREKFTSLENESAGIINNLQVNYQLTNQELQQCKDRLSVLDNKNEDHAVNFSNKRRKSPVKRKKSPVKKESDALLVNLMFSELKEEKEKLQNEKSDLQLQVYELKKELSEIKKLYDDLSQNKVTNEVQKEFEKCIVKKDEEISRLGEEVKTLQKEKQQFCAENESLKLERSLEQQDAQENKEKYISAISSKDDKIARLLQQVQNTKIEKEKTEIENNKLRDQNNSLQIEINILKTPGNDRLDTSSSIKAPELGESRNGRKSSESPTDQEVMDILKQMAVPPQVSPLSFSSEEAVVLTNEETINNSLKKLVNRRRQTLRHRRRLLQKGTRQVDLYGALLALKKANINFIISNESLIPQGRHSTDNYNPKRVKYKNVVKKKEVTETKDLVCNLLCCKNSYMVLKENQDLVGFVEIKDEKNLNQEELNFEWRDILTTEVKQNAINNLSKIQQKLESKDKDNFNCEPEAQISTIEERPDRKRQKKSLMSVLKKRKVTKSRKKMLLESCEIVDNTPLLETQETSAKVATARMSKPKSPKTSFKRPVCSTRRSQRLVTLQEAQPASVESIPSQINEDPYLESPQSPVQETSTIGEKPAVIPLEKVPDTVEKIPASKIEALFNKLILYSKEEEVLNEIIENFKFQEPDYIAEAILERVILDTHDAADTKYSPAPLMTDVQRTMLGFMSKLEKSNVFGVFDSYLSLAEQRLLTSDNLLHVGPITRLYLAICKLQKNLTRMRKLCCDVFYFCGDLAVPFLFTVLTSWTEVLPHATASGDFPIAKVIVQVVLMKDCNKPGYNFMPLRDLLCKFYGYPIERWDYNDFFKELFDIYLKNPVRSSDFALLLYCKNRPEKWVYERIEEHLKPLVSLKIQDNFKATLVVLIGNLYSSFSSKSEPNYLPQIREWLLGLINDDTPDVVKRCVYLSLSRLKKK